jgi:hypothetical protein
MADAAGAVRLFLMYLDDPTKLVDEAAVKKAEAAVESAKDPLDRLQALAALERARQADGDQLQEDFVAQAQAYAEEQNIPVSAFREMGVPADVLAEAGFDVGTSRRRRRSAPSTAGRTRAPRVPLDEIKSAVGRLSKRFTLSDLADAAGGGSPATLRKAVDELIAEGRVAKIGPKEDHHGRGRAPTVYELS